MAKKSKTTEPPVRKSFLIGGGVVIGIALLAFVVNTFVLGGGGGGGDITTPVSTSAPGVPSAPPAAVPGTNGAPTAGTDTSRFPKNELTPGGRNPFSAQAKGRAASASTSVEAASVKAPATHTWQLLELTDGGEATILVDGKKKIVSVGDKLIGDYTFNSITGECVTVKGASTFGLCPGVAPFTQ